MQVNFPTRLYDRDYVIEQALAVYRDNEERTNLTKNRKELKQVAIEYGYSERWLRQMVTEHKKDTDKE